MYLPTLLLAALPLFTPTSASPQTTTIYQFPTNGSWIESLSLQPNGNLLATRMDVPELYSIDPIHGTTTLIHDFTPSTALMGIAALSEDIYAVVAGNVTIKQFGEPTAGSFGVWAVDVSVSPAKTRLITAIPEGGWLNGVGRFDERSVLVADSVVGVLWRVDVITGEYEVAVADAALEPSGGPIGANGVHVQVDGDERMVYFTNTFLEALFRVRVDGGAKAIGPVERVAGGANLDDFVVGVDGRVFVMANSANTVFRVEGEEFVRLAGGENSSVVPGPTSGVVSEDGDVLYVATCGGHIFPPGGREEPAKVVAIRL